MIKASPHPQAAELVIHNCAAYEAHMRDVRDYLEERLQVRGGGELQGRGRSAGEGAAGRGQGTWGYQEAVRPPVDGYHILLSEATTLLYPTSLP